LFWLPAIFLLLVCQKNVSGAYILVVSAHFGTQHINLVIPIIDFVSFFITGGLTNARERLFDLHLINTEDHLFPHNGLCFQNSNLMQIDSLIFQQEL
jgi:hypothetical protein